MYEGCSFSSGNQVVATRFDGAKQNRFYRRLFTCFPSLTAHELALPPPRPFTAATVRLSLVGKRSRDSVAMFSKREQRTWLKIECARGRTASECHQGLQEACGAAALPYRTVARWVAAFRQGRENVEDIPRSGHPPVSDEDVQTVSALVEADRNVTIRELAQDTGLALRLCIAS
ncbi:hypothetical protein C0J52_14026 [Blattella germanica]|nr:hypothetical protein C0J52_14026 [Blattella germanica]